MESVIKEIEFLNNHYLKVGFLAIDSQKKGSNKTTILEYAIYNEFGTKSIPARPFLRNTLDFNKEKIQNKIEDLFNKVIGEQINGIIAYKELGEYIRDLIIETINKANSWAVPLADSTVKKKGNNKILIDEGYLISSIRYQISTKNGTNIFLSEFKSI